MAAAERSDTGQGPFVGRQIIVLTTKHTRMQGTVYAVDQVQSNLVLTGVRVLDAVDPSADPPGTERDTVVFHSTEIEDVQLVDEPAAQPSQAQQTHMPAQAQPRAQYVPAQNISQSQQPQPQPQPQAQAQPQQPYQMYAQPEQTGRAAGPPAGYASAVAAGTAQSASGTATASVPAAAAREGGKQTSLPAEDFDFDAMNQKFDKASIAQEVSDSLPTKPVYNPEDDFFDSMSCEALEKQQSNGDSSGGTGRRGRRGGRSQDTFGRGSVRGAANRGNRGKGTGRGGNEEQAQSQQQQQQQERNAEQQKRGKGRRGRRGQSRKRDVDQNGNAFPGQQQQPQQQKYRPVAVATTTTIPVSSAARQ